FPDDFQQLHRGPLRGRLKGDGSIPLSMEFSSMPPGVVVSRVPATIKVINRAIPLNMLVTNEAIPGPECFNCMAIP
ncbi:hypothetical protein, partial [Shewanella algae]|uniref:hypothetical protein n=1 Tax=Shewanella algae TaxID=38313 RepID=UPI00313E8ACD